ncbi:Gpi-anchored wall transfer protein [Thalictrum thalictroides]|uniref:Gpi-anchored wall transfer protein n=1 Tax=Thalictrum thalictroides TaxID=46969 RepID=A0A7J6X9D7_THATH|nr:Gpi-anchored wall transfer protein [Thalictrum thalictroides]
MDPIRSSINPNKQLKEEFVSNLTGSSMLEIAALMTIIPGVILLRHSIIFKDPLRTTKVSSKSNDKTIIGCRHWTAYMVTLAIDFSFIVLPMLLFFTVLAEWTQFSALCLILLGFLIFAVKRSNSTSSYFKGGRAAVYSVREIISSYRVLVMIMTCLCILAVDFKIFPRRYGKTETYGTGLMDLGVGSFVLANALVSRQARNVLSMKWKTALLSTSPLIILGFGRLISTASVNYQVHVGEYGVHWNFFFTQAAVSLLTSLIDINPQYCGVLGLLILVGYQICLLCGLNEYLLSNERKWKTALLSTSPLIILGFGRLISTASVNYQVHVGEYGVHWNFFFTQAAVSLLTSLIDINPQYCGVLGLLILVGYQICLLCGLNEYLLSNERSMDFISQNKEGIFSIFGYWGMYLVGVHLGNSLFFRDNITTRIRSNQRKTITIWVLAILFWLSTVILDKFVESVSRRMCNLAYVTFVLAQNFQGLAVLMLSNLNGEHKNLVLEEAFNRNMLGLFLLANVLTGLINMYVDTISASSFTALAILIGYAFVLCIAAGSAELLGIKLKFW